MRLIGSVLRKTFFIAFILLVLAETGCTPGSSSSITVVDLSGKTVKLKAIPKRVVSLVPSATETLFAIGAGDLVVGLTSHDTYPREMNTRTIVGGFFDPSPDVIEKLQPDMILLSRSHRGLGKRFEHTGITLVYVDTLTMGEGFTMMELMGKISGRNEQAASRIAGIREQLDLVSRKVDQIPVSQRKRVMRLMGTDTIMTPGDESFQNELIRCAGGIPPRLGKSGHVVSVTEDEWVTFDPQLIYSCGNEWKLSKKFFDKPGWKDVEAVRKGNLAHFPCDLTCRASIHMGDFVAWLSGVIYAEDLIQENTRLAPDGVQQSRSLDIDLPYVKSTQIVNGTLHDFPTQTLCIDFTDPMVCLNSLAGSVSGITTVGNHYGSPPLWNRTHAVTIDALRGDVCRIVGREPSACSFLFTGARMDSLAVRKTHHKDLTVFALVTAGVKGNAIRSGVDEGAFYEPGTINLLILTNMRLTPRAQTRAIICATEAKSAALQDLDIRSSYSPRFQATGTGTDEVLIVEGRGRTLESAGGHSKLGELIAKAVYEAVKESISLQNGMVAGRSIFQRIDERKIDVYELLTTSGTFSREEGVRVYRDLQRLLLNPAHAGFLESAFALGTAYDGGLVCDLQSFGETCTRKSQEISGSTTDTWTNFVPDGLTSKPVAMALDALINGLKPRGEHR